MKRVDNKKILECKEEVRLFMVGVDASHLIPYVFKHYFDIGVDRIFYIDNNSSDKSLELLQDYDRVHVWVQDEDYGRINKFGVAWQEELLKKYGVNNWCILADTDELFIYPNYEQESIKKFTKEQENRGFNCVEARMIDMYSNKKVRDTLIKDSLIETCPYYDRTEYGCRERVLGFKPSYRKVPLIHYNGEIIIEGGFHNLKGEKIISNIKCGILHFKFISSLSNFINKHGNKMAEPEIKNKIYLASEDVNFFDTKFSFKYQGSRDLRFFERFSFDIRKYRVAKTIEKNIIKIINYLTN